MSSIFEGRSSDSPYIHMIWRGHTGHNYSPTCPADARWNLLLTKVNNTVKVTVEGPTNKAIHKYRVEPSDFLVIRFKLGMFMPNLPVANLVNGDALLPEGAGKSFWLNGSTWQFPDFENVETFVDRLVREGLLMREPTVNATLQGKPPDDISFRTMRRRFLLATGLTHKTIQQVERAQQAAALLEGGVPILDAVYQVGYADQPHMTRSLKRFYGQTPAEIASVNQP